MVARCATLEGITRWVAVYQPRITEAERAQRRERWQKALAAVKHYHQ